MPSSAASGETPNQDAPQWPDFPSAAVLDRALPEGLYARFRQSAGVCTDTRALKAGELFVALKGPSFNGNAFAGQALEAGALAVVVDEAPADAGLREDPRVFLVERGLHTLQALARAHRRRFKGPVFALTGSNGKTTTKELIAAVLQRRFRTHCTRGNLNNHIGVPLTLLALPDDAEIAVVEMGANAQGEIAGLARIAEPDAGLITNIGDAHLEGFGGPAGVQRGKGELYRFLQAYGRPILCWWDQAELRALAGDYQPCIRYGSGDGVQVRGRHLPGTGAFAALEVELPDAELLALRSRLIGAHNRANLLAATAVGWHFGVAGPQIAAGIAGYQPGNQRSEWRTHGANTLYLDAYNANPSSMAAALESLAGMAGEHRIGAVLGDMLEIGPTETEAHQAIADQAGSLDLDPLVFIGPRFGRVRLPEGARHFATAAEAGSWLSEQGLRDRLLLLKGSRSIGVAAVLEGLG